MDLQNQIIPELIFKKFSKTISEEENELLTNWINTSIKNKEIYQEAINEDKLKESLQKYFQYDINLAWEKIESNITIQNTRLLLFTRKLLKYAAIIILPLLISTYLIFKYQLLNPNKNINISQNETIFKPGTKTATLTLADGKYIILGETNKMKKIEVSKITNAIDTNYSLVYTNTERLNHKISYNTLTTPKGGEYHLILPDGSKAWLNASSKIIYPEIFADSIRRVEVEGEVYFEVAHVNSKPFIVNTLAYDITVLGTSFNVMAYTDEKHAATTLVGGKIKISTLDKENSLIINPGQQATLDYQSKIMSTKNVNVDQYVSWKEGLIVFNSERLESIMRKLSRWYNCEFQFQDEKLKDSRFTGSLNKYQNLSQFLNKIAETSFIDFSVSEKNIVLIDKK